MIGDTTRKSASPVHRDAVHGKGELWQSDAAWSNGLEPGFDRYRAGGGQVSERQVGLARRPAKEFSLGSFARMKTLDEGSFVAPLEVNDDVTVLEIDRRRRDKAEQPGKSRRSYGALSDQISISGPLWSSAGLGGQSSLSR